MNMGHFGNKNHRFLSFRWKKEDKEELIRLWHQGKSFEEMAISINEFIEDRANNENIDCFPQRSPRAVGIQCVKLGLITADTLDKWEKKQQNKTLKERAINQYRTKRDVFNRDEYKCVVCAQKTNYEFAHIIPFRDSRTNSEKEAITLCRHHHRHFDSGCSKCVKKIYSRMSQYYSAYKDEYEIFESDCNISRIIRINISLLKGNMRCNSRFQ